MIREAERYMKKYVDLGGVRMGYVDVGQGEPVVFLHGNPASSYLWRNVIPHVENWRRCIAPDLMGMGDSDKLAQSAPGRYGFAQQRHILDGFFEALDLTRGVTLVVHGWGSALGFDWANRHRDAVKGIAYMEAIVASPRMAELDAPLADLFAALRSPAGETLVLEDNYLVEEFLPRMVIRDLTEAEMAVYRRPYPTAGDSRRPILDWLNEFPFDGEPAAIDGIIKGYMKWLPRSPIAKLFVNAEPGMIGAMGENRALCRSFVNQSEVTVAGKHYLQEDSPEDIGQAIADWLVIMG
ncbi:MAG: haloalkane dehalogenase [Alphaproteobacteria bacterium]